MENSYIDYNHKSIQMKNITKKFGDFVANDNINLTVHKGEVHALLGENGAGKSTLMNILYGLYTPTSGEIHINEELVNIENPSVAISKGIGMVHQHFMLIGTFTVAQNIILGSETTKFMGTLDMNKAIKDVEEISKRYGLAIDPMAKVDDISVGMQQRVEILKALYRGADMLILDEPTAVLTPQEIEDLIKIIRNLTKEGKSVIIITHKLKEIKAIADHCTVIRRGKYIDTVKVDEVTEDDLATMMVGREVNFKVDKEDAQPKETVLEINDLVVKDSRKISAVDGLSLEVRAGEIVGIAGVEGNGQTELVEALTGMRQVESGIIEFKNKDITKKSIRERIDEGMAHIPEDRHKRGLILDYTMEDNMVLKAYKKAPFSKNGLINRAKIREYANKIIETFDVRSGEGGQSIARSLSGGNQQKGVIGREIESNPDFLIAVQPTRGLDVGSIEYIHKRLVEQRDLGKAVLLVSLELDEVLNVSDRIAVVNNGELVGIVNANETNENEVGLMMAGVKKEEA